MLIPRDVSRFSVLLGVRPLILFIQLRDNNANLFTSHRNFVHSAVRLKLSMLFVYSP